MQKSQLEPGLLQIFRFYAWLRLASFFFFSLPMFLHNRIGFDHSANLIWVSIFMFVSVILLLGYLYWRWLEHTLRHFYIPIALACATSFLIIEQHLFFIQKIFWQAFPFLYILLILVAWQYSFRVVVAYTLGVALLETSLNLIFPLPAMLYGLPPDLVQIINYGMLVARSITFLLIGYVVNRLMRAQRQQRQALAEANQKLVSHAATLEQLATSRERLRLSRELHDTLAHTLSASAVQVDAILTVWENKPAKAKEMLEQMLVSTRSGLDETRRALSALRASPLEEMGLAVAVRTLAEDFAARHSLSLALDIPENLDDLSPEVEQCFYRVTQEALENVVRHANASQLSIALELKSGTLSLTIADDGSGFNPEEIPGEDSLGITGMRERAELIGADLSIESQPGKGAEIRLISEQSL